MQNENPILIVGAGIAGLSLAVLLTEKNLPCLVLEARESFDGPTSGVRISAKGVAILEKMGIRNIGAPSQRLVMQFGSNMVDFAVKKEPQESPAILVTRLALFEKLRDRMEALSVSVRYGFKLKEVKEMADGVEAVSEDGQTIKGAYLVGADGVGSRVRVLLNPNGNSGKRYAGYLGVGWIFPEEKLVEMTIYNSTGGNIGQASIGKKSEADPLQNLFTWLHLHMPEEEAKAMTKEDVLRELTRQSEKWPAALKQLFDKQGHQPETVFSFGPVYNGSVPERWYSDRLFLIGDAAHPYGPGGQGISMALKDAEALAELFESGITEAKKAKFQSERAAHAKAMGEAAEERNKPENQHSTQNQLFFKGLLMKCYHLLSGGKIAM